MVLQVMSSFHTLERELTDRMGVHYQFKILPYRTIENKIDGSVITIVDIAPDKARTGPNERGLTAPLKGITAKTAASHTVSQSVHT